MEFESSPEQERLAHAYMAQLQATHEFDCPIATRIDPASAFYPAEAYHWDYLVRYPDNGYITVNDLPKVRSLQQLFPENWQDTPVMVGKLASSRRRVSRRARSESAGQGSIQRDAAHHHRGQNPAFGDPGPSRVGE